VKFQRLERELNQRMAYYKNQQRNMLVQGVNEDEVAYLAHLSDKFEVLNVKFKNYFTQQRAQFARFFFLSDQQLLSLICSQNNIRQIDRYISLCFQGVYKFVFSEEED